MNVIDLLKAMGKPRYHGNGFIQLYLADDVRLHVWHPQFRPIRNHNAMVHTHRYDVNSTVYAGRLLHRTYIIDSDVQKDLHDVRIVQLDGASNAHGTPEIETGVTGKLIERHRYEFTNGAKYTMKAPYFHTSNAMGTDPIVTIFERSNKSKEWAKVLCGIDDPQATHAFDPDHAPHVSRLWLAIEHALISADHECISRIIGYYSAMLEYEG